MSDLDSSQFRQLCGRFATGVVVITGSTLDGSPHGMTANSFTSVSLEPPLISVNVDRTAEMHRVLAASDGFVINILATEQEALSRRFASGGPALFDGVGYRRNERHRVLLEGVIATLECEHFAQFDAGDHTIFVGRVIGGSVHEGRPLLYYRGGYISLVQG